MVAEQLPQSFYHSGSNQEEETPTSRPWNGGRLKKDRGSGNKGSATEGEGSSKNTRGADTRPPRLSGGRAPRKEQIWKSLLTPKPSLRSSQASLDTALGRFTEVLCQQNLLESHSLGCQVSRAQASAVPRTCCEATEDTEEGAVPGEVWPLPAHRQELSRRKPPSSFAIPPVPSTDKVYHSVSAQGRKVPECPSRPTNDEFGDSASPHTFNLYANAQQTPYNFLQVKTLLCDAETQSQE